jgi:hypothetical protein
MKNTEEMKQSILLAIYNKQRYDAIAKEIEAGEMLREQSKDDIEKAIDKRHHHEYIKCLLDDDIEKKEELFLDKVVKTVIDMLPKKSNYLLYAYIIVGFVLMLDIFMLVKK